MRCVKFRKTITLPVTEKLAVEENCFLNDRIVILSSYQFGYLINKEKKKLLEKCIEKNLIIKIFIKLTLNIYT